MKLSKGAKIAFTAYVYFHALNYNLQNVPEMSCFFHFYFFFLFNVNTKTYQRKEYSLVYN